MPELYPLIPPRERGKTDGKHITASSTDFTEKKQKNDYTAVFAEGIRVILLKSVESVVDFFSRTCMNMS